MYLVVGINQFWLFVRIVLYDFFLGQYIFIYYYYYTTRLSYHKTIVSIIHFAITHPACILPVDCSFPTPLWAI